MGYYKSLCSHNVQLTLYGVGNVSVPANATCVELNDDVAAEINRMAYPVVILEKTTPKITEENNPIVKPPVRRTRTK